MDLIIILLARLLIPFTILRWPLAGVFLSMAADILDYHVIGNSFIGFHGYQYVDKLLDTYFLIFMAYMMRTWADTAAKKIAYVLFFARCLGVAIFLLTGKEYILIFFPGIFIDFYLFYMLFVRLSGNTKLINSRLQAAVILIVLAVPNLLSEYSLHVGRILTLSLPVWLQAFLNLPAWLVTICYLIPPVSLLFYHVAVAKLRTQPQMPA